MALKIIEGLEPKKGVEKPVVGDVYLGRSNLTFTQILEPRRELSEDQRRGEHVIEYNSPQSVMKIGAEWLVDAAGCRPNTLVSVELLDALFGRVIRDLELHPLHEPHWHVFPPPGGVTGFVILSESHLACHSYPEHGILTVNLYCCRPRPEWPWRERLAEMFGAKRVEVRAIQRTADINELVLWP